MNFYVRAGNRLDTHTKGKAMLTVEDLQAKQVDLRQAQAATQMPKTKLQRQILARQEQIHEFDRCFALATVENDQETAQALKTKSTELRDELSDLEKVLAAYHDGTLSAEKDSVAGLGQELHDQAVEVGRFYQSEHASKLQAALELRKAYLAAIGEIGNLERQGSQCVVIVKETKRYVPTGVDPVSLRPNSISNVAHSYTVQLEEVFQHYGPIPNWFAR
jgi:hypothetical protein